MTYFLYLYVECPVPGMQPTTSCSLPLSPAETLNGSQGSSVRTCCQSLRPGLVFIVSGSRVFMISGCGLEAQKYLIVLTYTCQMNKDLAFASKCWIHTFTKKDLKYLTFFSHYYIKNSCYRKDNKEQIKEMNNWINASQIRNKCLCSTEAFEIDLKLVILRLNWREIK